MFAKPTPGTQSLLVSGDKHYYLPFLNIFVAFLDCSSNLQHLGVVFILQLQLYLKKAIIWVSLQ